MHSNKKNLVQQIGPKVGILRHFTQLTLLDISESSADDTSMGAVADLRSLRVLDIGETFVSCAGISC